MQNNVLFVVFLSIAGAKRRIEVKIRTENLHVCHVAAAQSGDNHAATLKANLI